MMDKGKILRSFGMLVVGVFILSLGNFVGLVRAEGEDASPKDSFSYSVAVFPFRSTEELNDISQEITVLVNTHLSQQKEIALVERSEIDKVLGEWELTSAEMVSSDTAVKLGKLIGAKVIVTGRVFAVQNQLMLVSKIIGVENGRVYGEQEEISLKVPYTPAAEQLGNKIYKTIIDKGPTLLAQEETPTDLIAPLKKIAERKKLPTIYINVNEHGLQKAGLTPSAETELTLVFQEVGFPVMDPDLVSKKADIIIEGEAFSDFAAQKENFISCKARVEVRATDQRTGIIIAVDRETATALDLSEAMAAETALQKASAKLAARLAEKILKSL